MIGRTLEAEFKPKMHKALYLDGKDDYVKVPDSPSISNAFINSRWTVVMRVNLFGSNAMKNALMLFTTQPTRFWAGPTTFRIEGFIKYADGTYDNIPTNFYLQLRQWSFIAISKGRKKVLVVYNQDEYTKPVLDKDGVDPPYFVIGSAAGANEFFNGLIASVYLYDRDLTKSEIKYLYHNPFDPLDLDHLVLWLTPASIDVAAGKWWDMSGKGNHGTIYGATEVQLVKSEVVVV